MGFKGIFGWLGSRGKKKEEEIPPNSVMDNALSNIINREIEDFLTYDPPKQTRRIGIKKIIPLDVPNDTWDKIKDMRFPKEINGKKYVFRVIRLQNPSHIPKRRGKKYFRCSKCGIRFEGAIFGYKTKDEKIILDIVCFNKLPDYVEPKIELSEEQRRHLSGILDRSRV